MNEENINLYNFSIFDLFDRLSENKLLIAIIVSICLIFSLILFLNQDKNSYTSSIIVSETNSDESNLLEYLQVDSDYSGMFINVKNNLLSKTVFEMLSKKINKNYSFVGQKEEKKIITSEKLSSSIQSRVMDHADLVISFTSNINAKNKIEQDTLFTEMVLKDFINEVNYQSLQFLIEKYESNSQSILSNLLELHIVTTIELTSLEKEKKQLIETTLKSNLNRLTNINYEIEAYRKTYKDVNNPEFRFVGEKDSLAIIITELIIEKEKLNNSEIVYPVLDFKINTLKEQIKILELITANRKNNVPINEILDLNSILIVENDIEIKSDKSSAHFLSSSNNSGKLLREKIVDLYMNDQKIQTIKFLRDNPNDAHKLFNYKLNFIDTKSNMRSIYFHLIIGLAASIMMALLLLVFLEASQNRNKYLINKSD
tara:strand:- start:4125 stop:5408 length:1284 start_codon:yes stop_codon:yes gene_type:complete